MVLTPQARAAVEASAAELSVTDPRFSIPEERRRDRETAMAEEREPAAHVSDHLAVVDGAPAVPVRCYRPGEESPPGLVVHLHGGGFVLNDVRCTTRACAASPTARGWRC